LVTGIGDHLLIRYPEPLVRGLVTELRLGDVDPPAIKIEPMARALRVDLVAIGDATTALAYRVLKAVEPRRVGGILRMSDREGR